MSNEDEGKNYRSSLPTEREHDLKLQHFDSHAVIANNGVARADKHMYCRQSF